MSDQAVETLVPALAALRAHTRLAPAPAWNAIADVVLGMATFVPAYRGEDELAGRRLGDALLDALGARGAVIRRRGTTDAVPTATGPRALPVRGSCCLNYKIAPAGVDGHCLTCPLTDAADRVTGLDRLWRERPDQATPAGACR